jgi:type IV secretion system protein VirB10
MRTQEENSEKPTSRMGDPENRLKGKAPDLEQDGPKMDPTSSEVQGPAVVDHVARVKKPVVYTVAVAIMGILFVAVFWTEQKDEQEEAKRVQQDNEYVSNGSTDQGVVEDMPETYRDKGGANGADESKDNRQKQAEDGVFSPEALEERARREDARRRAHGHRDAQQDPWREAGEQERARAAQEHYQALRSPMVVGGRSAGTRRQQPAGGSQSGSQRMAAEMEAVPSDAMMVRSTRQRQREFYERDRTGRQTQSYEKLRSPRSPYLLQEGTMIPLSLLTAISSDIPGPIQAQVRSPVYDSVNGDYLLIPPGSRMVGEYSTTLAHGQTRLQFVWTRLILPNGDSIQMNAPGLSDDGTSGVRDDIDMHYDKIFGAAIASSILSFGAQSAAGTVNREAVRPEQVAAGQVGENVASVGARMVDRELDVKPTLSVDRGHDVQAYLTRDIELKPYKEN